MVAEYMRSTDMQEQPAEFFERLDQVRSRGYEMMASLQTAGVYNLSAPVLAPNGKAIAALTIPYITLINRPAAPDITKTIALLIEATGQLSELAGSQLEAAGEGR